MYSKVNARYKLVYWIHPFTGHMDIFTWGLQRIKEKKILDQKIRFLDLKNIYIKFGSVENRMKGGEVNIIFRVFF